MSNQLQEETKGDNAYLDDFNIVVKDDDEIVWKRKGKLLKPSSSNLSVESPANSVQNKPTKQQFRQMP